MIQNTQARYTNLCIKTVVNLSNTKCLQIDFIALPKISGYYNIYGKSKGKKHCKCCK
jgi:hypothetical protein